jgi:hypothetical protein
MKISTHLLLNGVKLMSFFAIVALSTEIMASTFYVRPVGDATSWTNLTGINSEQIITSNAPVIDTVSTYYFAKGTYVLTATSIDPVTTLPVQITPKLTTGKIFGGFSGTETSIDLAARELEDKDENGIIEPWEFKNETVFRGAVPASDLAGSSRRMLTITGGEVNGVTFFDFYYFGDLIPVAAPYSRAIILGPATSTPTLASDIPSNAGKMSFCTVRKIKAGGMGPIMMTNQYSIVDNCLFEECSTEGLSPNGGGGAIFMNSFGGRVQNSVLRNNEAKSNASNAGRGGAIYAIGYASLNPQSNVIIENCLIYNNTSANWGGAVRADGIANSRGAQIINCTMANNSTNGLGVASVELIHTGLIVNSIVLGDDKDEIRLHSANNFAASNIFGTLNGMPANPGTNMVAGKATSDLEFVRPTTFTGAIGSPDGDFFEEDYYDEIRKANFRISSSESLAVTTNALNSLPESYESNPSILIENNTLISKDMLGVVRTEGARTIGAYQFTDATGLFQINWGELNAYSSNGAIIIEESGAKIANIYSISGQLIMDVKLISSYESIPMPAGFYIVKAENKTAKVIVR